MDILYNTCYNLYIRCDSMYTTYEDTAFTNGFCKDCMDGSPMQGCSQDFSKGGLRL